MEEEKQERKKKISIQLSHYGLKDNGKRGRMMAVKDVRAVDNTVSQTITSTCREEPEQIGWKKRCAKGEAGPLGTAHPTGDTELDVNPAMGTPFPTGGFLICGAAAAMSLGAGKARRGRQPTLHPQPGSMPRSVQLPRDRASSQVSKGQTI